MSNNKPEQPQVRVITPQITPDSLMPPAAMDLLTNCRLCNVDLRLNQRHIMMNAKSEQGKLTLEIYAFCATCVKNRPYEVQSIGRQATQPKIITNLN